MSRVAPLAIVIVCLSFPCTAQVEIIQCSNSPSPPAQGVCEVTAGDGNYGVGDTP